MYAFVYESESKRYRNWCSRMLTITREDLKSKEITVQFSLVGSGKRNMITRNGDGPYDLDYNLEVIRAPKEYWQNLSRLKETIRVSLNKACNVYDGFTDAKDSTSVLTSIWHFDDESTVNFSFDVAIVARNENGTLMRLIHNKNAWGFTYNGQVVWNEVPSSHDVSQKADRLAKDHYWEKVRSCYLDKKNKYLMQRDTSHPSFIIYVEAVNEVHGQVYKKGGKRK